MTKKHLNKFIWVVFILLGIVTSYFIWMNGISKTTDTTLLAQDNLQTTKTQPNTVQINEQKQESNCSSDQFKILLDNAETLTETGDFDEAMELYREAYRICPRKEIEEQMAWLFSKIPNH